MSMEKINDLHNMLEKITAGGGADKTAKQHKSGKLTARERIKSAYGPGQLCRAGCICEAQMQ